MIGRRGRVEVAAEAFRKYLGLEATADLVFFLVLAKMFNS